LLYLLLFKTEQHCCCSAAQEGDCEYQLEETL